MGVRNGKVYIGPLAGTALVEAGLVWAYREQVTKARWAALTAGEAVTALLVSVVDHSQHSSPPEFFRAAIDRELADVRDALGDVEDAVREACRLREEEAK